MNNNPPSQGRMNRQYPNGLYPWKIRPGFIGGGGLVKVALATCSISATNLSTPNITVYGSPVSLTGDPLPDMNVGVGYGLRVSVVPVSMTASTNYNGVPPNGLTYNGGCQMGIVFYQAGQKFDIGGTYWTLCGNTSQYMNFYPYGYYGGRYNASNTGTDLVRGDAFVKYSFFAQAWPPPYIPDKIGLSCWLGKTTINATYKVMILWQT
jgi:hypothetical protein